MRVFICFHLSPSSISLQLFRSILFLCFAAQIVWAVSAPSQFQAKPAGPTVTALSWANTSSEVTSYELQRYDNGWVAIVTASPHITHYYDRGLASGLSYDYRIRSVSGRDVSAWVQALTSSTLDYQPNIIFFLADDMGHKDIVALRDETIDGPTLHETPRLMPLLKCPR